MGQHSTAAFTAMILGLALAGASAGAESKPVELSAPNWIAGKIELVTRLGLDPIADLEVKGNYHWRWRANRPFVVGKYHCPSQTTLDVASSIVVVMAPPGGTCSSPVRAAVTMLKVDEDGSAEPLPR